MPCELFSTPEDKESSKEGAELGGDGAVLFQSSPAASPASPGQHSPTSSCCTAGTAMARSLQPPQSCAQRGLTLTLHFPTSAFLPSPSRTSAPQPRPRPGCCSPWEGSTGMVSQQIPDSPASEQRTRMNGSHISQHQMANATAEHRAQLKPQN